MSISSCPSITIKETKYVRDDNSKLFPLWFVFFLLGGDIHSTCKLLYNIL